MHLSRGRFITGKTASTHIFISYDQNKSAKARMEEENVVEIDVGYVLETNRLS
jgi:hypothetical protein